MVQMINTWVLSQRERQVQREEAQELTEKLDQDWRSIQALMVKKTPKAEQATKQEEKPKVRDAPINQQNVAVPPLFLSSAAETDISLFSLCFLRGFQLDEYDMMVRELGFEMKAQPSEKMKTPEELAREETEKLQKLEVCSQSQEAVVMSLNVF